MFPSRPSTPKSKHVVCPPIREGVKMDLSDRERFLLVNCGSSSTYENSEMVTAFRCFYRKNFARSKGAEVDKRLNLLKEKPSVYCAGMTFHSSHQHLSTED